MLNSVSSSQKLNILIIFTNITRMTVIYVLKCEKNRYYIGKTDRPLQSRVEEHFYGKGSAWTKKYKPIKVVEEIKDADEFDEDKYTKKYMKKYGISHVRGGSYTEINLPDYSIQSLQKELCSASDLCFRCNRTGHFVKDCYASTKADGSILDSDSDESDYDIIDCWCCDYCNAEFDTAFQCEQHEKKCNKRTKTKVIFKNVLEIAKLFLEDDKPYNQKKKEYDDDEVCFRCGRPGHYASDCYAKTHVNGRKIYK